MPPAPKHPSVRQRTNKVAGARTLTVVRGSSIPELPDRVWHPQTLAWWRDVWASPMAPEYDTSDLHGLFVLAVLVDDFWREPSQALAAEIRLQRQCFGLSPIDRRRLQWEIERGEEATQRTTARRAPKAAASKAPKRDAFAALK